MLYDITENVSGIGAIPCPKYLGDLAIDSPKTRVQNDRRGGTGQSLHDAAWIGFLGYWIWSLI
jgi:hypothetical protein